jgi:hypothetical protein
MADHGFTTTFAVDRTPTEAFDAITNIRRWNGRGRPRLPAEDAAAGPGGRSRRPYSARERGPELEGGHHNEDPPIVTPREWEAARQQLLVKEKEVTRARDALAAERRRMPWLAVEKEYAFDGPGGRASLLDLFEGRRQLIVYRAFFEPGVFDWPDHACRGCSPVADQVATSPT